MLEDPKFKLIEWYSRHAITKGAFYEKYLMHHTHFYQYGVTGTQDMCPSMTKTKMPMDIHEEASVLKKIQKALERCAPFPGDELPDYPIDPSYRPGEPRFEIDVIDVAEPPIMFVYDRVQGFEAILSWELANWNQFSIGKWFAEQCAIARGHEFPWEVAHEWIRNRKWTDTTTGDTNEYKYPYSDDDSPDNSDDSKDADGWNVEWDNDWNIVHKPAESIVTMSVNGMQVDKNKYVHVQRNAARVKGTSERLLPKPIVIQIKINNLPVRALIDSGSLGDFISASVVDQMKLKRTLLEKPLGLQLAVQGSRSKINASVTISYSYQNISDIRQFDVANLNDYDVILGTPWIYQHQVCIGLNPARIVIGSNLPLPITSGTDTKFLLGVAVLSDDPSINKACEELMAYAEPLCREVEQTELPPLRAINHTIPLIDENKVYSWRPSRCPEVFREQWNEKRDAYLKSGRWQLTTARNTSPMLLIPKPHKPKNAPELRTVYDCRERNKNTVKLTSPLPDIDGVLRRVAAKRYRSVLDLTAVYEQIRIVPEHVERSAMSTPDGNMVSLVLQMGDCNAPATYQSLMNYLFSSYVGRFLDVYLDDIIIYSDNLQQHIEHCKIAMDILAKEKLYLSKKKLRFLPNELKLLGRVIDANGIKMDSEKVDDVLSWKTPTNRDLLRGFIGSVGYLADDIPGIRLPLGILSAITGDKVPFRWTHTEQRAFDEAKALTHLARSHSRRPITYGKDMPQVWMITDGCLTGIAGVVSQGEDWKTAVVAAFYSAKLNNAQKNYPVHEIEMLAGVETMLRHKDILQGVHFKWITDHKGLIYLLNQKALSGRQARWLEKISSFVFEVVYVAGSDNVLADSLSRLYSNDAPGTVRAQSEFTEFDITDEEPMQLDTTNMVLLAGIDAIVATHRDSNLPGAETGRPESSKEFAQRMKTKFILRGPQERTKGGKIQNKKLTQPETINIDKASDSSDQEASNNVLDGDQSDQAHTKIDSPIPDVSLVNVVENDAGIDLLKELKGHYQNDTLFKSILDKPKEFRNFEVKDNLVYLKENGKNLLCIPKMIINGRSVHEIIISEAHSILAHLGPNKTVNYLRDHVWWKDLASDTKSYCDTCVTCKRSKPNNQKPYGLLNPLAITSEPWESIGVDFVGPLPISHNRDGEFDSITVVICLLTAMVEIIPSRIDYKARDIAELMFEHVYKHHGLPKTIVSDRDVLFTSVFWNHLNTLIGIKLKMSSAYHPQTDGATERANRTITQMLRQCINPKQKDWVSKLPTIQFAINSARSESTGFAPFFLNNGRMPKAMIWNSASPTEYPNVREFALKKKLALISAHDSIIGARIKQTRNANRKRQIVPFVNGDFVYLSTKNITFAKGLARKLIPKFIGPYKIIQDFNNQSFKIELPAHLKKRGVHDVFHSSLLKIHMPNDDRLFPGRMDTQIGEGPDSEDEWAIDVIRSHAGSGEDLMFEILWKTGDITWMPLYQVKHVQAFENYLELLGINEVSKLPAGKGKPPREDPQVFLGVISLNALRNTSTKNSTITPSLSDISFLKPIPHFTNFLDIKTQPSPGFLSLFPQSFKINFNQTQHHFDITMPQFPADEIFHTSFRRLNNTAYLMTTKQSPQLAIIHAGQIAKYLEFDECLRQGKPILRLAGIPIGYSEFATAYNEGAHPDDRRRFSTFRLTSTGEQVQKSLYPVYLKDFAITPEQCGVPGPRGSQDDDLVYREYAKKMARQSSRQAQAIQDRVARKYSKLISNPTRRFGKRGRAGLHPIILDDDPDRNAPLFVYDGPIPDTTDAATSLSVHSVTGDPEQGTSTNTGTIADLPDSDIFYSETHPSVGSMPDFFENLTDLVSNNDESSEQQGMQE